MTSERRYDDEEIARILDAAVEGDRSRAGPARTGTGLTLKELQGVGEEVGISAASIARAAAALDTGEIRRRLGVPVGVAHAVPLPRAPSDREWQGLVADLRQTFRAPGRLHLDGGLRGWSNGNLQAFVEPWGAGYRLRMETFRESARSLSTAGGMMLLLAILVLALPLLTGRDPASSVSGAVMLAAIGLGMLGVGLTPLPAWARERRTQMEDVGQRLLEALETGSHDSPGASPQA